MPLRLHDWTFVFAQPTSPRELVRAQAFGGMTAAKAFLAFSDWQDAVLKPLEQVILPMKKAGLAVALYPSSKTFVRLLHDRRCVILFTHADGQSLEFRDGMVSYEEAFGDLATDFCGIVDVTACNVVDDQDGLIRVIKRQAPRCAVRASGAELSPISTWLALSAAFLSHFVDSPMTMIGATEHMRSLVSSFLVFEEGSN